MIDPAISGPVEIASLLGGALTLALALGAVGHALLTKRDPRSATIWLLAILLLPLLGVILYLLFGINRYALFAPDCLHVPSLACDLGREVGAHHLDQGATGSFRKLRDILQRHRMFMARVGHDGSERTTAAEGKQVDGGGILSTADVDEMRGHEFSQAPPVHLPRP